MGVSFLAYFWKKKKKQQNQQTNQEKPKNTKTEGKKIKSESIYTKNMYLQVGLNL